MALQDYIAARRGRLDQWLASSISNRITFAALSLTMLVALVIGASSYCVVTLLVRQSVEAELNSQARLALQKLQAELNGLATDLSSMAGNSFIANGLVDSLGRDTYLLPFLHEHSGSASLKPAIVLCDYQGRPVAGNQVAGPALQGHPVIGQVIAAGKPRSLILRRDGSAFLVLVQPVIFPPTGMPEGVLVETVDLLALFRSAAGHLGREYIAHLLADGVRVSDPGERLRASGPVQVRHRLVLTGTLRSLDLGFEIGLSRSAAQNPLAWVALLYLFCGMLTLLLVLRFSQATARRLTLPLSSLSRTVSSIAASGSLEVWAEVAGNDEVGTLAGAFNEMLRKLRASQEDLESQVAERTRQLREAHDLLESRVVERTEQLTEANLRLEREIESNRELEQQLRQVQKMEAIGTLAGGIAHDFNNILTVIGSYSAMACLKISEADPVKKFLDHIMTATERAAKLTGSLLAFSRKQIMNPEDCDLNAIVGHLEKFLQRVIGEDIQLSTVLRTAALPVRVDSGQIEQVLMNLAANARDAMPRGGILSIETGLSRIDQPSTDGCGLAMVPGDYAVLSVADSGTGMDRATMAKIFEPFYTTKEVGKGTGLGLSMAYGIVKQNNGYIEVASELGRGTVFTIYLPQLTTSVQPQPGGAALRLPHLGGSETLLVADDDEDIRLVLEMVLGEAGYRVILAMDGQDAVEKFTESRQDIHLVLLDMIMPRKSGKESYHEIRRLEPSVKVLFSSGYVADYIKDRGELDEGAELVSKPVHPAELLRKVRELLDR
jgi:signal transduction histidine kinase/CheY-like chemotaxis protein